MIGAASPGGPSAPAAPGRTTPVGRRSSLPVAAGVAAVATAALILHARSYLPFVSDDALISLRYARRLLEGAGLTWTDGERVEGYSNLLWVLGCAALGRLGLDLVDAARALGLAGMAAAIAAVVWARPPRSLADSLPAASGALALALAAPAAVWTVGGLEQPLVAALLAWALALCLPLLEAREPRARDALGPGLLLGLLCLARPDGPLLGAAAAAGLAAVRGAGPGTRRAAGALLAWPAAFTVGQLAFRLVHHGDWVPNAARAKIGLSLARLAEGLGYLAAGLLWLAPLVVGALLALRAARADPTVRRRALFLAFPTLAWSAYVIAIGGDIFPGRRHLVPLVVALALLLASALGALAPTLRRRTAGAAMLALFAALQLRDPEGARARAERWEWDGAVVGRMLERGFGARRPLLAVDPAGCLPYFSNLPAIDMLGLNDRYLGRHRPAGMGRGMLGHELGDGDYVLARAPDLVLFCSPAGSRVACFRSGQLMQRDPRFAERYLPVTFEGDAPRRFRSLIWVRWDGGRLGIEAEPGRIGVPGWLLASNPAGVARLDREGRMGMTATAGEPAVLIGLVVPDGRWSVAVEAGGPVRARVSDARDGAVLAEGTSPLPLAAPGRIVTLEIAPAAGESLHVRRVTLTRDGK